jgi:hypothetical protein
MAMRIVTANGMPRRASHSCLHPAGSDDVRIDRGAAKKNPLRLSERVLLTTRQTAAIAAFSVALGRIAADVLAALGR